MRKTVLRLLQLLIVVLGIGILGFMLYVPHSEGRNAHATFWEVYLKDPFLAFAYIASISVYLALYNIYKILGYIGQNRLASTEAQKALQTIQLCALAMIGFDILGIAFIFTQESDDRAGGIMMGLLIGLSAAGMGLVARWLGRRTI